MKEHSVGFLLNMLGALIRKKRIAGVNCKVEGSFNLQLGWYHGKKLSSLVFLFIQGTRVFFCIYEQLLNRTLSESLRYYLKGLVKGFL